ncbi:Fc.00g013630.m01.CDS01 [Cosmosporella sp. VM-42]
MAPSKRTGKSKTTPNYSPKDASTPPAPFKRPPEVLGSFIDTLDKKHVYITHIDSKPVAFKRKIFLVPVAMNVGVVFLFAVRMWWILPWYWKLVDSVLGYPNETTFPIGESTLSEGGWEVAKRVFTMAFDFILFVFVWPWPVEFVLGQAHSNPTQWRWNVGFREKEIYVRRSREWDTVLKDFFKDDASRTVLFTYIRQATSPIFQEQKTGYLLMNGEWDLDWAEMVYAHSLVDKKNIALEAFKNVVLVHHKDYSWLVYDLKASATNAEDSKRRQFFAFRDALAAMGKESLFYRWVEIVQFESTQPDGFGPEKQKVAEKKIRELFEKEGINFEELWRETVGTSDVSVV